MKTTTSPSTFKEIVTATAAAGKIHIDPDDSKKNKVLTDMILCHTQELGYTSEVCTHCFNTTIHYASCNNTSCPQCGNRKRKKWVESQEEKVVNAPYYHIIFTVPDKYLNGLFIHDPKYTYNAIMSASAETLKAFAADPEYLGVQVPGFFSVLHTWGSNMSLHVHVHTLFCAAGLDDKNQLVMGDGKFLFPAKALAKVFKGKFLSKLRAKYGQQGSGWNSCLFKASNTDWNVEIKHCPVNPLYAIRYTGRYVNRIAISPSRIVSYKDGKVSFRYKDYKDESKIKVMSLTDEEFMRRFFLHVLPDRFIKVRNYGFLGNNSKKKLKLMQELTRANEIKKEAEEEQPEDEESSTGPTGTCEKCGHITVMQPGRRLRGFKEKFPAARQLIAEMKRELYPISIG